MGQGWKYTIIIYTQIFLSNLTQEWTKRSPIISPSASWVYTLKLLSKLVHHFATNVFFNWHVFFYHFTSFWYIGLEKIHQFKLGGDYLVSWSSVLSMVGEILPAFEILILTHNNRIGIKEKFEILILTHSYIIGMKDTLKRLILRYFEHLYTASTSSLR